MLYLGIWLTFLVLLVLKLTHQIAWAWPLVASPLWASFVLLYVIGRLVKARRARDSAAHIEMLRKFNPDLDRRMKESGQ